jgi:hypothetical protein
MPRQLQKPPLRQVTYEVMGKGNRGCTAEPGDVLSLLFHYPFFFVARIVPPMSVVNDFGSLYFTQGGDSHYDPL